MHNTYTLLPLIPLKRGIVFGTPKSYAQSLSRSIAFYRRNNASQDYLNYLYGLYYEALDDLWESQQ